MKRLIATLVSLVIISVLVTIVELDVLIATMKRTHLGWFAVALFLFIPQTVTIAWRWKRMVQPFTNIGLGESLGLVLSSNTMNLILPSKLGDLTKGYFLRQSGKVDLPTALNVVVFEKMLDVAALAAVMLLGAVSLLVSGDTPDFIRNAAIFAALLGLGFVGLVLGMYFFPWERDTGISRMTGGVLAKLPKKLQALPKKARETMALLRTRGAHPGEIIFYSIAIWALHLLQIYAFFWSVGAAAAAGDFFALVPLSIFIGLIPITLAGFGTRDAALVALFPAFPSATMFAAALYVNLRYILPAIAGLPFLHKYIAHAQELKLEREAAKKSEAAPLPLPQEEAN